LDCSETQQRYEDFRIKMQERGAWHDPLSRLDILDGDLIWERQSLSSKDQ
jgi:hypothetical protein